MTSSFELGFMTLSADLALLPLTRVTISITVTLCPPSAHHPPIQHTYPTSLLIGS